MTDIMMTPPPQPPADAPGAPARQRKRRYVQVARGAEEEAAPDQVVQRQRQQAVRVSSTDVARIQRYTPEQRWERISSGRWKFSRARVTGNNYVHLTASESDVRGDNNHIYGNNNVIAGDNNVVHGDNNVVHGSHTVFHGVGNIELLPEPPAQATIDDPFAFQDSDDEQIDPIAFLNYVAAAALAAEANQEQQRPVPPSPTQDAVQSNDPPPPRQTDERVRNELMPKVGQPPDQNNWKVSLLDITGESKTPARQDLECCLCLTAERDVLYEPCGHMTSCRACTRLLYEQGSKCPQCRAPIQYSRIIFY